MASQAKMNDVTNVNGPKDANQRDIQRDMNKRDRAEVRAAVELVGLVPVVRAPSAALAVRAVDALLAGGVSVFEITMTVPGAVGVIEQLVSRFGDRVVVGAGTVLSVADARACIRAGASFVVSPGLDLAVVEEVKSHGVCVMPGALTPTEVITAWKAGADMVKIFPCSALGGPRYLKALRGPLPDVKFLPTGGVTAATAGDYIAAGASALGVGSELVDIAALEAGQDAFVAARARELVAAVEIARAALRSVRPRA
jgi:2-dehydro-3-deoxyphosphogluconate aldolase/(4S)-4-hydroxy-2-oxoglutarate aldolase